MQEATKALDKVSQEIFSYLEASTVNCTHTVFKIPANEIKVTEETAHPGPIYGEQCLFVLLVGTKLKVTIKVFFEENQAIQVLSKVFKKESITRKMYVEG